MERDLRTEEQLVAIGWRVLVVWQCDLLKHTTETIQTVALWLARGNTSADHFDYGEPTLPRGELLEVAEKKVRYRIDSYSKRQCLGDAEGEDQP